MSNKYQHGEQIDSGENKEIKVRIKTGGLTNSEKIDLGVRFKEDDIWEVVFQNLDWSLIETDDEKFTIGHMANNTDCWLLLFRKINWLEVSLETTLRHAYKANHNIFWIRVISTNRLEKYILLSIGNQLNNGDIWEAIINTGKLEPQEMQAIYNLFPWDDIFDAINEQLAQVAI